MSSPVSNVRPTTVTAAFLAWLVAIALGLVTTVILFISAGTAVAVADASTTANFYGITYVFAGLLVLALTVIEAAIVWRMRAGRNWARVTLTVLAVLQIFNAIFSVGLNPVLSILGIVIVAVATVLMWMPAANVYFGRRTTVAP